MYDSDQIVPLRAAGRRNAFDFVSSVAFEAIDH